MMFSFALPAARKSMSYMMFSFALPAAGKTWINILLCYQISH
jgi:hypothetical protein